MLGVTLRSDTPIPRLDRRRLHEAPPPDAPGVDLRFGDAPESIVRSGDARWSLLAPRDGKAGDDREPAVRLWRFGDRGPYRYRYRDSAEFWIDGDGSRVWATRPSAMSIEDLSSYLLGPVWALVLRLRGIVCLHASGVRFRDGAIAFAGAAHAGKSTLAAAFALAGHEALSDDTVALMRSDTAACGYVIFPDAPYLNLWPRSAELLLGDAEALPRWSESWDKRFLHLEDRPGDDAWHLKAIYELALAHGDAPTTIVPLHGHEAVVALLRYARASTLLGADRRPAELETLSEVVRRVSVRRVERARSATPQSVRDILLADLEHLGPPPTKPTR